MLYFISTYLIVPAILFFCGSEKSTIVFVGILFVVYTLELMLAPVVKENESLSRKLRILIKITGSLVLSGLLTTLYWAILFLSALLFFGPKM